MENVTQNNQLIAEFMAEKKVDTHHNMYHESWNELMPVIFKINNVDTNFKMENLGAMVSFEERIKNSILRGIEQAHMQVVFFINFYNKNK